MELRLKFDEIRIDTNKGTVELYYKGKFQMKSNIDNYRLGAIVVLPDFIGEVAVIETL